MWSVFKRIESSRGRIGVFQSDDGVAIAQVLSPAHNAKPRLTHCSFTATEPDALAHAARQLSKRKLPLVSVLPAGSYHMLLVEAPDVPEDELRAAVRWRIKDLIDFHIDDAVIDVFQMPQQSRGGPNQMMYAIAARAEHVREQITAAEQAGLNLEVIDIFELALRNIATMLEDNGQGLALLYLYESSGVLLLVRQGVLYLTRRIETSAQMIRGAGGLRSELIAGLALETRRSLDYFESHYEQSPISVVHTMGLGTQDLEHFGSELGVEARHVNLVELFDADIELDEAQQHHCLPAIGAALRHDRVTL